MDGVEDALGDDRVERRLLELLERDGAEPLALGRVWIDAEHVVAGRGELAGDPALASAADLEHARGRRRQMRKCERREVQGGQPRTGSPHRGPGAAARRLGYRRARNGSAP